MADSCSENCPLVKRSAGAMLGESLIDLMAPWTVLFRRDPEFQFIDVYNAMPSCPGPMMTMEAELKPVMGGIFNDKKKSDRIHFIAKFICMGRGPELDKLTVNQRTRTEDRTDAMSIADQNRAMVLIVQVRAEEQTRGMTFDEQAAYFLSLPPENRQTETSPE